VSDTAATGATEAPAPDLVFEQYRRLLFTVAYDLLGSAADAEDVVQDAWLRWSGADVTGVRDPRAFLVTVTTRLALNRLRDAKARREAYVGPWLPEPLLTAPDVADDVEAAEAVSLALLVVLETLTPLERAVFVLREVFGLSYPEVAAALQRSEAAVRQVGHRAPAHVDARRPRFDADRATRREVTGRFLAACAGGDVEALLATLAPGVTLVTDGGGLMKAALRRIVGAGKVARFLAAVTTNEVPEGLRLAERDVNAAPGLVLYDGDEPWLAVQVHVRDGLVEWIHLFRNPQKLATLRSEREVAVR
jgi:RNA polymerase sigma-70 factor (TIGR02957 family)